MDKEEDLVEVGELGSQGASHLQQRGQLGAFLMLLKQGLAAYIPTARFSWFATVQHFVPSVF